MKCEDQVMQVADGTSLMHITDHVDLIELAENEMRRYLSIFKQSAASLTSHDREKFSKQIDELFFAMKAGLHDLRVAFETAAGESQSDAKEVVRLRLKIKEICKNHEVELEQIRGASIKC